MVVVHPAHMDYRVELFDKLNAEYDVTFIFTKQGRGQDNVKEEQETIPSEWKSKVLKSNFVIHRKDIGMFLILAKELIFGKYDLVLTSTSWYVCWISAKISGKKFVFVTEIWCWKNASGLRKILNKFTKFIAKRSDAIFAMGTKAYNSYIEMGVDPNRIFMYPQCAVDYSGQFTFDVRDNFGLKDKKIILFLGRLVTTKGVAYLIEAFSLLEKVDKQVFLIIGGEGPNKKDIENLAKQLDIKNIRFVGAIKKKEIASYYSACDVFVLPSIFNKHSYEPWGLVVNEAMAFGKPVITTTAVGSGEDLIENDYNGYVVGERNVEELYEAMNRILSDNELLESMGKNSIKMFEKKNNFSNFYKTMGKSIMYAIIGNR